MTISSKLLDLCARLEADPLFSMSRASKELFHTNLLGWIAAQHADLFIGAFDPWLVRDPQQTEHRVRREWHHLDLVVELSGYAPLVIEAKVFALPDEEQLSGYSDLPAMRALGDNSAALLLTLDMPSWRTKQLGECDRE